MPASLQHVPDNIKCEIQYRTSLEEFLKFQIKNSYTMKKFWVFFPFKLKYIANFIQLRIKNACDWRDIKNKINAICKVTWLLYDWLHLYITLSFFPYNMFVTKYLLSENWFMWKNNSLNPMNFKNFL